MISLENKFEDNIHTSSKERRNVRITIFAFLLFLLSFHLNKLGQDKNSPKGWHSTNCPNLSLEAAGRVTL
jgi:hypothetical protein